MYITRGCCIVFLFPLLPPLVSAMGINVPVAIKLSLGRILARIGVVKVFQLFQLFLALV